MNDYYIDHIWRANRNTVHPVLAELFESDVQGSLAYCQITLDNIDAVLRDPTLTREGMGNAFYQEISASGVKIGCEYDESMEPLVLSLDEAKKLFEGWMELFSRPKEDIPRGP